MPRSQQASIHSARLGLSGKLDLVILTPDACYPVDFKDTEGGVRRNHRVQLAAYAMLAEEAFGRPAPEAFVYLVPAKEVVRVPVTAEDRAEVARSVSALRQMVAEERMPGPTSVRARCVICEYRNFCADIW